MKICKRLMEISCTSSFPRSACSLGGMMQLHSEHFVLSENLKLIFIKCKEIGLSLSFVQQPTILLVKSDFLPLELFMGWQVG